MPYTEKNPKDFDFTDDSQPKRLYYTTLKSRILGGEIAGHIFTNLKKNVVN